MGAADGHNLSDIGSVFKTQTRHSGTQKQISVLHPSLDTHWTDVSLKLSPTPTPSSSEPTSCTDPYAYTHLPFFIPISIIGIYQRQTSLATFSHLVSQGPSAALTVGLLILISLSNFVSPSRFCHLVCSLSQLTATFAQQHPCSQHPSLWNTPPPPCKTIPFYLMITQSKSSYWGTGSKAFWKSKYIVWIGSLLHWYSQIPPNNS